MQKILFLDSHDLETSTGFTRCYRQAQKDIANPLFVQDQPWENSNMQLYGSVVKVPNGPFQLWYSSIQQSWKIIMAYAESDDGVIWRKPALDFITHDGMKTNILLTDQPHGPAVIYDPQEADLNRRYKLLCGIASSGGCISAFVSPDGINWRQLGKHPVINTDPDCPIGLFRRPEGKYVALHRVSGFGRRVLRSESWDFTHWSEEPRMVLEPGPFDDCQIQFYGFGSTMYGNFEIGTLWIYHTDPNDLKRSKMVGYEDAEFTFARSGYAIHRLSPGRIFLPHGAHEDWDSGNLQCASQPVFLPDEIRYYYAGSKMNHKVEWELEPQKAGLGLARLRPDGFVSLEAGSQEAVFMTVPFKLSSNQLFVNADFQKDGWIKAELLNEEGAPIAGFGLSDFKPVSGDSLAHRLEWTDAGAEKMLGGLIRLKISARKASIYSIYNLDPGEDPVYWRFRGIRPWW